MSVLVTDTNVTCAIADPISLAPLASFQAIKARKAVDLYFCFDTRASSIICTKPLGLGLHAPCEAIIVLLPLPSGNFGFIRGFCLLSNMTCSLNVVFEFPAHVVGSFKNIFPTLCGELLTIEQVCGLFQPLLCTYITLGFFFSLVPTILLQSFSRSKLNPKFRKS